jgi:osomolarity two-component system response regulator SKN7
MNDVLPKPFTKEGLLSMLDKHLGHLKKSASQIEGIQPPPPPTTLGQVVVKNPLKAEDSTPASPATASNWASPGTALGMSPVGSEATEYGMGIPGHPTAPFLQSGMAPPGMPTQVSYGSSPGGMGTPRGLPPAAVGPHRRHISDISGGPGDLGGDIKRHMFASGPPQMQPPLGPGVPMGQNPLNPLHRRSG